MKIQKITKSSGFDSGDANLYIYLNIPKSDFGVKNSFFDLGGSFRLRKQQLNLNCFTTGHVVMLFINVETNKITNSETTANNALITRHTTHL